MPTTTAQRSGLLEECDLHELIGCVVCNPPAQGPAGNVNKRAVCEPVVQALLRLRERWGADFYLSNDIISREARGRVTPDQVRAAGYMLRDVYQAVDVLPGCLRLGDLTRYRRSRRTIGTSWDWPGEGRRA